MSSKFGCLFFILLLVTSFTAQAQNKEPELKGYTPPPMFGGSSSTPLSPPPVELPAPAPVVTPPAPAVKKEPRKVTRPPADKEQVLKDQPLPIEPLTPRTPQEPTPVPQIKTAPDYVAPVVKYEKPEPVKPPGERPVEKAPLIPLKKAVERNQPLPAINAEDLLGYPVTSSEPAPAKPALNPLAVPASPVEDGLPLPGSVPAQKKATEKKSVKKDVKKETVKSDTKKVTERKPANKKSETKKESVKVVTKPVEKKPDVKKVEKKVEAKPVEKAALPKTPAIAKPEPKKEELKKADIKPVEIKAPEKKAEAEKPDDVEPYNVKGRKSMPTIKPTKVERTELEKLPLPAIESPSIKTIPSPNEKMIDQSLQDRLVEPDVKKIMDNTAKPKGKSPIKDTPPIVRQNFVPETNTVVPQLISLEFIADTSELKADQKKVIDTSILPKLKEDNSRRLQILSYASPSKEGQSSARRISLARGLTLRSYLLEKGIQPSRIDIRALGEKTKEKPLDRVDLVLINFR